MKRTALLVTLVLLPFLYSCATAKPENSVQEASAHYKIGVGYYSENKVQQAFVEFQRAYELNPNNRKCSMPSASSIS